MIATRRRSRWSRCPIAPAVASIFNPLAEASINVDMIVQNVAHGTGSTDVTVTVPGAELAERAQALANDPDPGDDLVRSARNRFVGLVTAVRVEGLMAQIELQSGPHRIVSLMSSEAAAELGLEVGSKAVAVTKATMMIIEAERA